MNKLRDIKMRKILINIYAMKEFSCASNQPRFYRKRKYTQVYFKNFQNKIKFMKTAADMQVNQQNVAFLLIVRKNV